MAELSLTLRCDTSDIVAALRFVEKETGWWPNARRDPLYAELEALNIQNRPLTVDVDMHNETVFGSVSPQFLAVLRKHGLAVPEIPTGGAA